MMRFKYCNSGNHVNSIQCEYIPVDFCTMLVFQFSLSQINSHIQILIILAKIVHDLSWNNLSLIFKQPSLYCRLCNAARNCSNHVHLCTVDDARRMYTNSGFSVFESLTASTCDGRSSELAFCATLDNFRAALG